MRYILTILMFTLTISLNGQSLEPRKKNFLRYDTIGNRRSPSRLLNNNQFIISKYSTPGKAYIDYYQVPNLTGEVIIQNSIRRGGSYTNPAGKEFFHTIFWARVINETEVPLKLNLKLSADSFAVSADAYIKIFFPPDTMSLSKTLEVSYGATGLKSFMDTGLDKPTTFQKTLDPKEDSFFYIAALFYNVKGATRIEVVLKENELFLKLSGTLTQFDSMLIPCGSLTVVK